MLKFILPGYYLFYSRLKSKLEKISWFIIYVIPIYIIGMFYTSNDFLIYSLLFVLAVLIFNSIYETGYIENDTRTILNEKQPTMRLQKEDYKLFEEKYFLIIFYKFIVAIILIYIAQILANLFSSEIYIMQFIAILIVVRIFFFLHNKIRNRANILTFFALAVTKYSAPLFLILPPDSLLSAWVTTLFLFPFLRAMEHATKKKYGMKKWMVFIGDFDKFRIKYYTFMSLIIFVVYFLTLNNSVLLLLSLLIYFLFYRMGSYILVKKKYYQR